MASAIALNRCQYHSFACVATVLIGGPPRSRPHLPIRPLRCPKGGVVRALGRPYGAHSLSRTAALAVARFKPAIAAVGARCFGHHCVHDPCVWQAWQPASPATARKRTRPPTSRASLTSVHARLSAAGPKKSVRHPTTSHAA